jgi:hypothetical protein
MILAGISTSTRSCLSIPNNNTRPIFGHPRILREILLEGTMASDTKFGGTSSWLRAQWSNPGDAFTILLIIGGDIVQTAIAQLCAGPVPYLTPVSFSFGWVSSFPYLLVEHVFDSFSGRLRCLVPSICCWREQIDAEA